MSLTSRRRFIAGAGAAFAVGSSSLTVRAAMGPDDKFDLLIKGGEVLDPSQGLRGKRDVGMRFGTIRRSQRQGGLEFDQRSPEIALGH